MVPQVEYDIPDQVWSIVNIPSGLVDTDSEVYTDSHSYKLAMLRRVDIHASFGYKSKKWSGAFSASYSYKKIQRFMHFRNSSKFIEELKTHTSGYKVNIMPEWVLELGRVPKIYIKRLLPSELNSTTIKYYTKFIRRFGTHFFSHGNFGGIIRLILSIDKKYFYKASESYVMHQAKLLFNILFRSKSGKGTIDASSTISIANAMKKVDSNFLGASKYFVRYYGGNTNLMTNGGPSKWQGTVLDNPWLYGGGLTAISQLFKDSAKKEAMERAVQIYTDKVNLDELLTEIRLRFESGKWVSLAHKLGHFQYKIKQLLADPMPDHNEVQKLSDMMSAVPYWFQESMLCMKWTADPGVKTYQCNNGKNNEICAKMNSMTEEYIDQTDDSRGGCQLSWGIVSAVHDDWLKNVSVCFKWFPDVQADGRQCGANHIGEVYAHINHFTANYIDDTDRRYGGCKMQWMLSVSSEAPLWMQNTRFCMTAKPQTLKRSRTSGGTGCSSSVRYCVYANKYTSAYLDDTNGYQRNCKLQWGIFY